MFSIDGMHVNVELLSINPICVEGEREVAEGGWRTRGGNERPWSYRL